MNIVLAGSNSILSSTVFHHLLHSDHAIVAVGVTQQRHQQLNGLIQATSDDIELLAMQASIDVITFDDEAAALKQLQVLQADALISACYPQYISTRLCTATRLGGFNIHPSLLPEYRGPEPLFWQFRDVAAFGVSLHRLSPQFDAGDLVAQQAVTLPQGCDYHHAMRIMGRTGAGLLLHSLQAWVQYGVKTSTQDESQASYLPYPTAVDFAIDCRHSAKSRYNFICGTLALGQPYYCDTDEGRVWLDHAIDFVPTDHLQKSVVVEGDTVWLQCRPGVLKARLATGK